MKSLSWFLLLCAVFLAPLRWAPSLGGFHLAVSDILILFSLLTWIVYRLGAWGPRPINSPPLLMALPAAAALLSALSIGGPHLMRALAEAGQAVLYLVVLPLLIFNLADGEERLSKLVGTLLLSASAVVVWGSVEFVARGGSGTVKATLASPAIYGGYVAMTVPLLLAVAQAMRPLPRLLLSLLAVVGSLMLPVPGAALGLVAGLAALSSQARVRFARPVLVLAGVLLLLTALRPAPQGMQSLQLHRAGGELEPRYVEWVAGISAIRDRPLVGVGPGNYQENIGYYYSISGLPYPTMQEKVPDWHNFYILWGTTTGAIGLAALVLMLVAAWIYSGRGRGRSMLLLGLRGSLAAFLVCSLFSSLLVRGTGLLTGLVLAMIFFPEVRPDEREAET